MEHPRMQAYVSVLTDEELDAVAAGASGGGHYLKVEGSSVSYSKIEMKDLIPNPGDRLRKPQDSRMGRAGVGWMAVVRERHHGADRRASLHR